MPEQLPTPPFLLLNTGSDDKVYTVTHAPYDYLSRHAPSGRTSRNEYNTARRVARCLGTVPIRPIRSLRAEHIERWLSTALAEPAQAGRNQHLHPL